MPAFECGSSGFGTLGFVGVMWIDSYSPRTQALLGLAVVRRMVSTSSEMLQSGRIRTRHVINPPASVASGLRALTCLSLLRFRKRKNLTILIIIQFLQVFRGSPGGGKLRVHSRRRKVNVGIAFWLFLFLE